MLPALTILISSSPVSLEGGGTGSTVEGERCQGHVCHTASLLARNEGSWAVIGHGAWWSHRGVTQFKCCAWEKVVYYNLIGIILMAVHD